MRSIPMSILALLGHRSAEVSVPGGNPARLRGTCSLPVELHGTLRLGRDEDDDAVDARVHGELVTFGSAGRRLFPRRASDTPSPAPPAGEDEPTVPVGTRVDVHRSTSHGLALAEPYVWLQMVDARGAGLTYNTYLGHGSGVGFPLDVRVTLPARAQMRQPGTEHEGNGDAPWSRTGVHVEFVHGLYARVLIRTYGSTSGPRLCVETLLLPLVTVGQRFHFLDLLAPVAKGSESQRSFGVNVPRRAEWGGGISVRREAMGRIGW
jgi:hypothetical protein